MIKSGKALIANAEQREKYHDKYSRSPDGCLQYVTALIRDELGGILAGYNKKHGVWQIPSGKIEVGEHPADALKRELQEETGLEVTEARFVGTSKAIFNGMPREASFFETTVIGALTCSEPDTMDEFTSMRFFACDTFLGFGLTDGKVTVTDPEAILRQRHMFAEVYRLENNSTFQNLMQYTPVPLTTIDPAIEYIEYWDTQEKKLITLPRETYTTLPIDQR